MFNDTYALYFPSKVTHCISLNGRTKARVLEVTMTKLFVGALGLVVLTIVAQGQQHTKTSTPSFAKTGLGSHIGRRRRRPLQDSESSDRALPNSGTRTSRGKRCLLGADDRREGRHSNLRETNLAGKIVPSRRIIVRSQRVEPAPVIGEHSRPHREHIQFVSVFFPCGIHKTFTRQPRGLVDHN